MELSFWIVDLGLIWVSLDDLLPFLWWAIDS